MAENYGLWLEKKLAELEREGKRPRLLLQTCCAPCSSYVFEYIARAFDITAFFYNPTSRRRRNLTSGWRNCAASSTKPEAASTVIR